MKRGVRGGDDMIQKLFLGVLVFTFSACASAPTKNHHTNDIDNRAYMEISFPSDLTQPDDFAMANKTDARSLVLFALKLEKKLKFA